MKTLVAGVGNIFLSDDGFGVEVVRQLQTRELPEGVELVDVGIRGIHLAYQLLEGYDLLVLIDTVSRGEPPGTLMLIEPDPVASVAQRHQVVIGAMPLLDVHGMEPGSMLGIIDELGARVGRILVVGCQPADLSDGIGLTESVSAAVPGAVAMVLDAVGVRTEREELR
ncbi:MAG: hydrogenase maturation protease [Actinobacteria bacterium]|nr:hydrogenase maturation protease [Actinomycetota bacterium]